MLFAFGESELRANSIIVKTGRIIVDCQCFQSAPWFVFDCRCPQRLLFEVNDNKGEAWLFTGAFLQVLFSSRNFLAISILCIGNLFLASTTFELRGLTMTK